MLSKKPSTLYTAMTSCTFSLTLSLSLAALRYFVNIYFQMVYPVFFATNHQNKYWNTFGNILLTFIQMLCNLGWCLRSVLFLWPNLHFIDFPFHNANKYSLHAPLSSHKWNFCFCNLWRTFTVTIAAH